jgi:hypothetical protein
MNITIRNNRIYVENAELGNHFPGLFSNLIIDLKGRVNVQTSTSFYTDLACLDPDILRSISEKLDAEQNNKSLMKLKTRIDMTAKTVS